MAYPPADPIVLSAQERDALERLVRAHATPQQLALRAQIILSAADGIGNRESARRLGITVRTVRCWRRRWNDQPDLAGAARLADAPRPGTPATFTAEQICAIRILDAPFLSEFLVRAFSQVMRLPEPDGATDQSLPGRTWCA
jgi:putative transposase